MRKWILAILVACSGCCSTAKAQTEFTIQEFILFPDVSVIQLAKPNSISKPSQAAQLPSLHVSFPGGDIAAHLSGPPHYKDVRGMTTEQMLSYHDSLHPEELAKLKARFPIVQQVQQVQPTATSNCPGGVCPQQYSNATTPRLRIFGRWR